MKFYEFEDKNNPLILFADTIGKRYLLRLAGKQGGKGCRKAPWKVEESESITDVGDKA